MPRYLRRWTMRCAGDRATALPLEAAPMRFGSWMGGDRDGNPTVTPEVTRLACAVSRWMAADLYEREIAALRLELSMTEATTELRARTGNAREPYRARAPRGARPAASHARGAWPAKSRERGSQA